MNFDIFLSPPHMGGTEQALVKEAFETNWIAPYGPHIVAFEAEMAQYVGAGHALAVTAGTAAIHLALRSLGVGRGDLVFCSDFTFAASCNPALYQGAELAFIDSEPDSFNMSPVALEKAFVWAEAQGRLPKAVIIVDLYGESADWDALLPICARYGVPVLEDAAEALGSTYKGRHCGTFGDVAALSFNGNKIITTSGGGMVLSENASAIDKMRYWSTQAREPVLHYQHEDYGYNYRMSNVCAAIGRGQLAFLPEKLAARRRIHTAYTEGLAGIAAHIKQPAWGEANCWLSVLVVKEQGMVQRIIDRLAAARIETRPAWKPMHMQPVFAGAPYFSHGDASVCEDVFAHAICLPSGDSMTKEQQARVIAEIRACFAEEAN